MRARPATSRGGPPEAALRLTAEHGLDHVIVETIAERDASGPGTRSQVMAAAFLVAMRVAAHLGTDEHESRTLREVMEDVLDEMAQPFDGE